MAIDIIVLLLVLRSFIFKINFVYVRRCQLLLGEAFRRGHRDHVPSMEIINYL